MRVYSSLKKRRKKDEGKRRAGGEAGMKSLITNGARKKKNLKNLVDRIEKGGEKTEVTWNDKERDMKY